jgi:hypothetical protein
MSHTTPDTGGRVDVPRCPVCDKPCKKAKRKKAYIEDGYNVTCGNSDCIEKSRRKTKMFRAKKYVGVKKPSLKGTSLQNIHLVSNTCPHCGSEKSKGRRCCEKCSVSKPWLEVFRNQQHKGVL